MALRVGRSRGPHPEFQGLHNRAQRVRVVAVVERHRAGQQVVERARRLLRVRRVRRTRRLARERGERARPFPGVDGPQRPARVHGRGTDLRVLQPDNELAECLVIQIQGRRALRVPQRLERRRARPRAHREVNESTKRAQVGTFAVGGFEATGRFREHDATRAQCHCPGRRITRAKRLASRARRRRWRRTTAPRTSPPVKSPRAFPRTRRVASTSPRSERPLGRVTRAR